jgi:hypothetical protein
MRMMLPSGVTIIVLFVPARNVGLRRAFGRLLWCRPWGVVTCGKVVDRAHHRVRILAAAARIAATRRRRVTGGEGGGGARLRVVSSAVAWWRAATQSYRETA